MNSNNNQQHHDRATGLKSSLHGVFYQLKLILLVLLQMCKLMDNDENLVFEITTEDPDAGKFDDTVCKYIYNGVPRTMCIQAKHKMVDHKITFGDLTSTASKAPFALARYFTSFLEQKRATIFGDQSLILCTNADLHDNMKDLFDLQPAESALQPDMSDIFDSMGAKCYRFNVDKLKGEGKFVEIRDIMENCSDCNRLAKLLAATVHDEKKVTLQTPLFSIYRNAIANNIVGTCRDSKSFSFDFKEEFITNDTHF
uniref:Uncharacterized protein n=1 Tax=Anopheles atroparvus TaxID=41427 RepID=A0AAG5DM95_ANOAO